MGRLHIGNGTPHALGWAQVDQRRADERRGVAKRIEVQRLRPGHGDEGVGFRVNDTKRSDVMRRGLGELSQSEDHRVEARCESKVLERDVTQRMCFGLIWPRHGRCSPAASGLVADLSGQSL
jgi:hypothetical protein